MRTSEKPDSGDHDATDELVARLAPNRYVTPVANMLAVLLKHVTLSSASLIQ